MPDRNILLFALLFESGLVVVAFALGLLVGVAPFGRTTLDLTGFLAGVAATLPMLALLWFGLRTDWAPLARLVELARDAVASLFSGASVGGLALVSVAAGVGEEALFRGVLQEWLTGVFGPVAALAVVSLLFGAAHALSRAYFVAATVIGFYLGALYLVCDNLLPAIVAHALYDFVALLWLTSQSSSSVKRIPRNASGR